MPPKGSVFRWLLANEEFRDQYRAARETQAEGYVDEQVDIADEATPETANVAKLRCDARKWFASKILAKKYGEKSGDVNVSTTVNTVLIPLSEIKEIQDYRRKQLEGKS